MKVESAAGIQGMRTIVLWLCQPAASTSRFILSRNMRQRSNSVGDVEFDAEPQFYGQDTISLSSFLDPAHRKLYSGSKKKKEKRNCQASAFFILLDYPATTFLFFYILL